MSMPSRFGSTANDTQFGESGARHRVRQNSSCFLVGEPDPLEGTMALLAGEIAEIVWAETRAFGTAPGDGSGNVNGVR